MGLQTILFLICLSLAPTADNQEKVQKKELEAKVRTITAEAQKLEKAAQLAEARSRYAESQALIASNCAECFRCPSESPPRLSVRIV